MALISSDPATNGVALVWNHQEDTNASLLLVRPAKAGAFSGS